jgi:hypothetical protein
MDELIRNIAPDRRGADLAHCLVRSAAHPQASPAGDARGISAGMDELIRNLGPPVGVWLVALLGWRGGKMDPETRSG